MRRLSILFLLSLAIYGCASTNCSNAGPDSPFGFLFEDSFSGIRTDTFNGTLTLDWWTPESTTICFSFTSEELDTIRDEMRNIEIFSYPANFQPKAIDSIEFWIDPHPVYFIRLRLDGREHSIYWNDRNNSRAENAQSLRLLLIRIRSMVVRNIEYKKFPRKPRVLI